MSFLRILGIFIAFVGGYFLPELSNYTFMIRYLVMFMLTSVFLHIKLSDIKIHSSCWKLAIANVVIALLGWFLATLLAPAGVKDAIFYTGISPTATAAAVIVAMLGGSASYVVGAFLLTNIIVSISLIFLVPIVSNDSGIAVFYHVLSDMLILIVIPFIIATIIRKVVNIPKKFFAVFEHLVFIAWILTIFIIISDVSEFLREQKDVPIKSIVVIALSSLTICVSNFIIGRILGEKEFKLESSQSLGHKNTALTIFIALNYGDPLAPLGPGFYVLWQNLVNSFKVIKHSIKVRKEKK